MLLVRAAVDLILDEMGIAEFNAAHPGLEAAPEIFKRDFASPLESLFRENEQYHCAEITVFRNAN
ncbi:hypothetical protein QUB19_13100 [Microcoleus sp. B4-C5]